METAALLATNSAVGTCGAGADLMGEYRNNRTFNVIAWTTCIVMIVLTLWLVIPSLVPSVKL